MRYRSKKFRSMVRAGFMITGLVIGMIGIVMHTDKTTIPPEAYAPLLNVIAKGESNGNYNAYFGNAGNTELRLTEMTIEQVLVWQEEYVRNGSYSNAAGRYQIIRPTLAGLVKEHKIDTSVRYDEAMQDNLAIKLLERRGSIKYVENKLPREQFAANLAKEWAALPKMVGDNPEESYYASDGVNKSLISVAEVYVALEKFTEANPDKSS